MCESDVRVVALGDIPVVGIMLVAVLPGDALVWTNGRLAWYEAGSRPMVLCFRTGRRLHV